MSLFFHPSKRWCDRKCASCDDDCRHKLNWAEEVAAGVLFLVVCLGIAIFSLVQAVVKLMFYSAKLIISVISASWLAIFNPLMIILGMCFLSWMAIWWTIMWLWAPLQ